MTNPEGRDENCGEEDEEEEKTSVKSNRNMSENKRMFLLEFLH